MTSVTRRAFVGAAGAGAAGTATLAGAGGQDRARKLKSLSTAAQPITAAEHTARLEKLQGLMQQHHTAALLVEAGSTLEYFTGIRWWRSERTTAALIPARGSIVVVTPYFEEPSIRETLKVQRRRAALEGGREPLRTPRRCLRAAACSCRAHSPSNRPHGSSSSTG